MVGLWGLVRSPVVVMGVICRVIPITASGIQGVFSDHAVAVSGSRATLKVGGMLRGVLVLSARRPYNTGDDACNGSGGEGGDHTPLYTVSPLIGVCMRSVPKG